MDTALRVANLALLVLFPVAWFALLLRAGLLPLFGLSEISIVSGLPSLWGSDVFLAVVVTALALFCARPWRDESGPSYPDLAGVLPYSRSWIGERVRAWRDGEFRDLVADPRPWGGR